ncbi:hypothetical protein KIW84_012210 [Lathyrus oleraceus]|uniref:DUF7588 domain-containing protein n=1 Tax=Pisum sativum TaxID=3888 RepID=A0A9D5BH36_PEA|nr:hypothetical protein KIW84_012210 [Pisum sativum]
MSLADEFTKNSLVIYVQGLSDNFNPGVANIDVISRITYKVSNVNYDFKSLKTTPRNETCIIEANLSRSNVMTPKILTASDIIEKFPQEWILQDVVKSEKIEARTIRDVIQDIDGSVRIRMNRSQSYRYHQSSSIGSTSSARHSVDSTIRVNLAGVNFAPTIPRPLYSERTSRSPSPTESQILGVITNDDLFVIDKAWIRADFEAIYNLEKRNWYFSNFSKDHTQMYLQKFYRFLETHEINIYFFTWFELLCLEEEIENPFAVKMYLDANVRISTKWKTSRKEIIESVHPPLEAIRITPSKENIEIEASPFKSIANPVDQRKDINNLHSQINYSNQILHTMSQQLDRIENSIPQPKDVKDYKLDPTRPIYQYHTPSNQELKGMSLGRDTTHKIEELVTKLKSLNIETSSGEINTLSRDEEYDNMGKHE